MSETFFRNIMFWGDEVQNTLAKKHVAVFGLGGVGGYTAEALARAGIGKISLIDFDEVSQSNINRQIIALHSTLGQKKVLLFKNRLKDINPELEIIVHDTFYDETKNAAIFAQKPDFVVDAIDTMRAKIDLLAYCHANNIPVISSMGAGNRIDPTKLFISDISEIKNIKCNFVKNVLYNLNKKGINSGITGVFSSEKPKKTDKKVLTNIKNGDSELKKFSPSSTPIVPPIAGYYAAYHVLATVLRSVDKTKL